jgi:hypothetical protein
LIDSETIPQYSPDEFAAIGIHCFVDGTLPAVHVQAFDLSFPVGLDYDSELFRQYRLPGKVFPLNVVFDAQGQVVHVGTVLEEAQAAIAAELP